MVSRVIYVVALMTVLFAPGCNKKQTSPPADNTPAPGQGDVNANKQSGNENDGGGSWVHGGGRPKPDPNANTGTPNTSSNSGNPGIVVSGAAPGGGVVTNPGAVAGGGGGGGAAQAVRKAVRRTEALNELKNIGEIIESMRDPLGKMPTKDEILAELKKYPKLYTGVTEGAYILTGTTDGGGLWAYEVDAETKGGIIVVGGRATRATADEVRQYMGR